MVSLRTVTFAAMFAALPVTANAAELVTLEVESGPLATRQQTISFTHPIGQSFTAFSRSITSIGFEFGTLNPGAANSPLTFSLFQGETLTGTPLFTQSFSLPETIASRGDRAFVDLALPDVAVTNGAFYTAVLSATSARAALIVGPDFRVQTGEFLGGDAYAGGRLLASGNIYSNCQGANNNCDANFRVTGEVPEPSTWAMMLVGFGAIGSVLRRRRSGAPSLRAA